MEMRMNRMVELINHGQKLLDGRFETDA